MDVLRKLQYFTGIGIYLSTSVEVKKFIDETKEYFEEGNKCSYFFNGRVGLLKPVVVYIARETQVNGKPLFVFELHQYEDVKDKLFIRQYLEFAAFKTGDSHLGAGDWMYQVRHLGDGSVFYETTRVVKQVDSKMAELENGVRLYIKPNQLLEGYESFTERDGQIWHRGTYTEINALRLKNSARRAKLWFEKKVFIDDEMVSIYNMFNL